MMDFIYELYQNDNFVLYLTIALVILIVLFVLVLIFGKRDQKLEETKRLQKIDVDAFKEEKKDEVKVEVPAKEPEEIKTEKIEEVKEEIKPVITEEPKVAKSIFDDTQVLPIADKVENKAADEEIKVTTFEPIKVEEKQEEPAVEEANKKEVNKPLIDIEEESKPINIKELDEINFDDINLEKDLGELENIKNEFDSIKIPEVKEVKEEKKEEKVIERNETKPFKPSPQVFSSVFVKKEDPVVEEVKEEIKTEEKPKVNLFSIQDDEEEIELPPLKSTEEKKEETKEEVKIFSFDDISGETYNIK
mgnify:FL=1